MTNGNDNAFPNPLATSGLTKRELFAAMAMSSDKWSSIFETGYEERAKHWLAKADALIKQLNKQP